MSEITLDSIINVAVKPRTDLSVSYGTITGDNSAIDYNTNTSIWVEDTQTEVTYELYQGTTPSGTTIDSVEGTGGDIALLTDSFDPLTENTEFCILAVKDNDLSAPLDDTVTVIVAPDPDVEAVASSDLIGYNQKAKIQILESQSGVIYRIKNYVQAGTVTGNGRTVELQTAALQEDDAFQVEAVNPDPLHSDVVVTLNGGPVTVQVRPDPAVSINIPDLNEQDIIDDSTASKVASVVRNRELTVEIQSPQTGVTYQLWQDGAPAKPDFNEGTPATNGLYTMQSGALDNTTSFQILATKATGNDVLLTDTVRVEIEEQVVLAESVVHYGSKAQVDIKASEADKTYTLYTGKPNPGGTQVISSPGDENEPDGIITLETDPLTDNVSIYVTQKLTAGGEVKKIAEFNIDVTARITAESTRIPYNSSAKIMVGVPIDGSTYQLRFDAHNVASGSSVSYTENGVDPVVLTSDVITETTTFNVTEDGAELSPVVTVRVIPHVSVESEFIPYNTPAVIKICDTAEGEAYTLSYSGGDFDGIAIELDGEPQYDSNTKITTLTTEKLTGEGAQTITVSNTQGEIGSVDITVGDQVTAASPVNYGNQVVVEVAATIAASQDKYELYDEVGLVETTNVYTGDETGITTLTTDEGLTADQTYDVVYDDDTAAPIATAIAIAVNPRVTAPSYIPYYTQAVVKVAATTAGKKYQLYDNSNGTTQLSDELGGNGGVLELSTTEPLTEDTQFIVKENGAALTDDNSVTVAVESQAYPQPYTVPYNSNTATIVVMAPEAGETYEAIGGGITYPQDATDENGNIIIPITGKLTESTDFEVYKTVPSEEKIGDVRIVVIHQLIESEIHIDYDGPAFIRIGASIALEDNSDYEVTYQLRKDDHNTLIGASQTGNGAELTFKTDSAITEDTLYNILAINEHPDQENEEFKVWVRRVATVPEADISTDGSAMVSYDDTATLILQTPDTANNTYEILNDAGESLEITEESANISYDTTNLQADTPYMARVNAIDTLDENNRVMVYLSRQTVMVGRLKFYGTYHFVNFPENTALQITGPQTIEMWVKAAASGSGEQILYDKARTAEGTTSINNSDNLPKYNYGDSAGELTADTSLTDQWTHIAVVRDNTNVQWYINGTLHGEPDALNGTVNATAAGARLGAEQTADGLALQYLFNGLLAEVRLWNVARDAGQISDCMNRRLEVSETDPTLAAYWKLDEGADLIADDASGHGITGIINGAIWEDDNPPDTVHHIIETQITIDQDMPVAVSIGTSRSDTQYKLLFANDDSDASQPLSGTDNETILTLITDANITADTRLKVITTAGEEVGTVVVVKQDPPVIEAAINGPAMVTYGDDVDIAFTNVANGTVCELCDEAFTILFYGTASSSITLTAEDITEDTQFIVRTKADNGQTVCISRAPLIMVGLLDFHDVNRNPFDYVVMPNVDTFHFAPDQDFSVEAWIKPETFGASHASIICNNNLNNLDTQGFAIYFDQNQNIKISASIKTSAVTNMMTTFIGNSEVTLNEWYHIAVVFERRVGIKIYLDGMEDSGLLTPGGETEEESFSAPLYFMADRNDQSNRSSGTLSDVRIWDKALEASEIQANMNTRLDVAEHQNLIGYWKLDDRSEPVAKDTTANGNDGTIEGAIWLNEQV